MPTLSAPLIVTVQIAAMLVGPPYGVTAADRADRSPEALVEDNDDRVLDQRAGARHIASPAPPASLGRSDRTDILDGVPLEVEEVGPGVFRVVGDAAPRKVRRLFVIRPEALATCPSSADASLPSRTGHPEGRP